MKNSVILLGVLLLLSFANVAFAGETIISKKLYPGMSVTQFKKVCPKLSPKDTGQIYLDETIHGLDGKWSFEFKDGKLAWTMYNFYIQKYEDLNEKNFNKCLKATEKIIADLTKLYGKPTDVEEGTKKFRDPAKDHHWGYEVIKATWKKENYEIKARFKFFGGKGEYFFLVNMEFMQGE